MTKQLSFKEIDDEIEEGQTLADLTEEDVQEDNEEEVDLTGIEIEDEGWEIDVELKLKKVSHKGFITLELRYKDFTIIGRPNLKDLNLQKEIYEINTGTENKGQFEQVESFDKQLVVLFGEEKIQEFFNYIEDDLGYFDTDILGKIGEDLEVEFPKAQKILKL